MYIKRNTPWGQSDRVKMWAEGIACHYTPSHGGIQLSFERQAEIKAAGLAKVGDIWLETPEWWEEDCDACKIIVFFFDEIKNTPGVYSDWQRAYDSSIESIRHHSPEWLERFNLFKNKILKAA